MTNKEAIERWAEYIIPAVLRAEDALQKARPEWRERIRRLGEPGGEPPETVAEEYCREIAEIIVRFSSDYEEDETWEEPDDFGFDELNKRMGHENKGDFS